MSKNLDRFKLAATISMLSAQLGFPIPPSVILSLLSKYNDKQLEEIIKKVKEAVKEL